MAYPARRNGGSGIQVAQPDHCSCRPFSINNYFARDHYAVISHIRVDQAFPTVRVEASQYGTPGTSGGPWPSFLPCP